MKKKLLPAAIRGALGFAASVTLLPTTSAFAQEDAEIIEEVIVTGSRIERANDVSVSPVTTVSSEDFKATGITRVEDLINTLPQAGVGQNSTASNGSTGTATVSLRNLGSKRTLVLIDGRRMPLGSPLDGGIGADLNQIPAGLVERVEVLTGGSSATYGSDAITGVVNFVMMGNFEGVRFESQTSLYQHNNRNSAMQNIVKNSGYEVADGSVTDGETNDFSLIMGANLDNGRGNVTAYTSYRKIDPILQSDRDYSGCELDGTADNFSCGGSSTTPEGRFALNIPGVKDPFAYTVDGNQFVDYTTPYNFAPQNYYQRPDERWTMGAFGHYDVSDKITAYTQLMYADDRSVSQIAPSGAFGVDVSNHLSCGNPFLSEQQFELICGQYGLGKDDYISDIIRPVTNEAGETEDKSAQLFAQRRNIEGGPRQQDLRHTSFRGVFGGRGDINEAWSFDLYGQYSEVSLESTYFNDLSNTKIKRSLDATTDKDGNIVCKSVLDGSDPNCVPWNIFQTGGVTKEATDYLTVPLFARGSTEQEIISGYLTADLSTYGVQLPTTDNGVAVVIGAESRRETLNHDPDLNYQLNEGAGQGGPTLPVQGALSVREIFSEAVIPLLSNFPGAQYLGLEMAYRFSDYSTNKKTETYKLAADWQPIDDLKLRASFQAATRHANIRELYRSESLELFDMSFDPCAAREVEGKFIKAPASLEACKNSGITEDTYNTKFDNPAGQYNQFASGDPDLAPEESETFSLGFVYSPSFLEGLVISLDYFNIEITDAITDVAPSTILNRCLETGEAIYCDAIQRASDGSLWLDNDSGITSHDTNTGFIETAGFDLNTNYGFELATMGSIDLQLVATYLTTWDQQELRGEKVESCVAVWGDSCGAPTPRFKSTFRAIWSTPWDVDLTGGWRHIGSVNTQNENGSNFSSVDYLDLSTAWAASDNFTLRGGINNVFDKEPPRTIGAGAGIFGNGNTFPGVYDALGRYAFLGFTVDF